MLIDWFTVGAQTLNFLILVWLLKRFLYQPILDAIDAREQRIAAELSDADAKQAEAQAERDAFQQKNQHFDQQRAALLSEARIDAHAERQLLLDEARRGADALTGKRQEALKNEAINLRLAIERRTQQEVFAIARKALIDLADTSLEERLVEVFIRRLRDMDEQSKTDLSEALKTATGHALIRTAFALPVEQKTVLQNALNQTFSADISLHFETTPDLIGGIEFSVQGRKLAWSIVDYLQSLQHAVDELLNQQDKPENKVEVSTEVADEMQ